MEGLFVTPAAGPNGAAPPSMPRRRRRSRPGPLRKSFAANLRQLREKAGLSQDQLAQQLGLGNQKKQYVSQWETELDEPTMDELRQLALIFNVRVEQLWGDQTAAGTGSAIPSELWLTFVRDFLTHYPGHIEVQSINLWAPYQTAIGPRPARPE